MEVNSLPGTWLVILGANEMIFLKAGKDPMLNKYSVHFTNDRDGGGGGNKHSWGRGSRKGQILQ